MTKYLVSGYVGFDNFGDEAIAKVLSEYLKSKNAEKITWISSNPAKTSSLYGVNAVGMLNFFDALEECDVLISGGGSLLQDITSLKSLVYYILIITLAIFKEKKVYIFAQGFSPFRTKIGEFLTKFVLKRCEYVSVRDKASQELLKQWGIKSELIPDPVYGIKTNNTEHFGIGIQLRKFPTLTNEFMENLAKFLSDNFKDKEIQLLSLQDSMDKEILEEFAQMLDKYGIKYSLKTGLSVNDTILEISKLEYLISMRFHACLIGAKTGVKVLGINYDQKVENLAKDLNFPTVSLSENSSNTHFSLLYEATPGEYNIPETKFPNFE